METKLAAAHKIMYCDEYLQSYNRLKEKGQLETLNYNVIHPVEKGSFSQYVYKEFKEIKKRRTKRKILRDMPTPIFNAFHSLKKRLGLIP